MRAEDLQIGARVWYLYTYAGDNMTHQEQVTVLAVRDERAKIQRGSETRKPVWVKIKNLRLMRGYQP